jgi:hypothetical protein
MRCSRATLAAALAALSCACAEPPPPDAPSGAALLADHAQVAALLAALSGLEGTPLGRRASELALELPDCDRVAAHTAGADLTALLASLRCFDPKGPLAGLVAARAGHGLALSWPLSKGNHLRGWLDIDAQGGVHATVHLPSDAASGPGALLLPGDEPPGPAQLSGAGSLLHARLRPAGGLDLASLVPGGGQGDRMFRLKSELFHGLVLDGTWETALYLPGPGEPVPRAALALGFSQRHAAIAALEDFIRELSETWPVQRSFFSHAGAEGACLLDLRILPGFGPCYVATSDALVLGYNPASLRTALDGAASQLGDDGGLLVELARFDEADARLAEGAPPAGIRSPWSRLRADASSDGGEIRVQLRLDARPGA